MTDLFPLIVAAMKELGKDNVTEEQVAIIKQAIEKYGNPDEIKYDYSIAPQWIKQRLAIWDGMAEINVDINETNIFDW